MGTESWHWKGQILPHNKDTFFPGPQFISARSARLLCTVSEVTNLSRSLPVFLCTVDDDHENRLREEKDPWWVLNQIISASNKPRNAISNSKITPRTPPGAGTRGGRFWPGRCSCRRVPKKIVENWHQIWNVFSVNSTGFLGMWRNLFELRLDRLA